MKFPGKIGIGRVLNTGGLSKGEGGKREALDRKVQI
jgi:hypothetical protein